MYDSPCRRRGNRDAGACARPGAVAAHSGTARDFLRRHERDAARAVRGNKEAKHIFVSQLLQRTADPRNLRLAWDYLASHGGAAPGVDGMRFEELEDGDVWDQMRMVGRTILQDAYRPAPDRIQKIPKTSGTGFRTLLIPTIIDRTVQRAIVQTTQPFLDPMFDDNSFGFRPRRDRLDALARAERFAWGTGLWVWITEDIRDAFNQVPLQRLLDVIKLYLPDQGMVQRIERVIGTQARRGLRQGGPLSPLLLNLYLHHFLDRPWKKRHADVPLIRVADDLLLLCRDRQAAERSYADLATLLQPAGMPLKGTPEETIRELDRGESATWLGFQIDRHSPEEETPELGVRLTEKAWKNLASKLALTHTQPDAPLRAVEIINGWVAQQGSCYSQIQLHDVYAKIGSTALRCAFDEIPSQEEIRTRWCAAHARWCRLRRMALR